MRIACMALAFTIPLLCAGDEVKIDWQRGRCLGGNQPSVHCKNCSTCNYCGKRGRYGSRPQNSATCVMCEHAAEQGREK